MEPLDFLAAVLPSPGHGYYCLAGYKAPKRDHVFVEDLADNEETIDAWVGRGFDTYFALSTFENKGSREAVNARYIRALFIDMDGYASKKNAANALSEFLDDTGLHRFGTPWVVASGGGLHCYWPFDREVSIPEWRPLAERFKRLCKARDLSIDMTVTADAARVLRIPGTINFKPDYPKPRPVQILLEGRPVSFEALRDAVFALVEADPAAGPALPTLELPGQRPANASPTRVKLVENTTSRFKNILDRTKRGDGCAQLAHYVAHAAGEGMEPLWRGLLSQAKFCTDGERAAVWLSKLHPYDDARMRTKLHEIKGPYSCVKLDGVNPGVCSGCKHWSAITNPLALGRELLADNTEKEVEIHKVDEITEERETIKVMRPAPPKGYSYGANGGIYVERIIEEADGTKRKQNVMLLPYDMFVVDLLVKDGEHTVHMVANKKDAPVDILMPQRYTVSKDDCVKKLAEQNILAAFGAGNDKNLFDYIRACVEEASLTKKAVRVPQQYGWQEDGTFVYNGRVFFQNGTERTVPMPDLANLNRATRPMGTLENWRKFPQMLVKRRLYDMLAMLCVGFGSPLMRFTQMSALTFHAGSTESGTGKSLTLTAIASIMGHPVNYRTGKSTSPVTMQQRMGNLNSLPFVSDEITHKSRQDMEWFPGLIFDTAEGKGKEKSEVYANRERINNVSWSLLAFLTSNMHMQDYMSGSRQHSSNGELFRMLEWTPNEALNWSPEETETLKLLYSNYGVAGEKYLRWLVQHQDTARSVVRLAEEQLKQTWRMSGDERFWVAGCAAVVAGAILASSKYADVVDIPTDAVVNSLFKLVEKARKVVRAGARSAEDVLNAFTREHYGHFIVVRISDGSLLAALGNGETVDQTITRSRIMGRVEHEIDRKGYVDYYIEEQVMKAHCVAMSFGYEDFKRQIQRADGYSVKFLRKDMTSRTRGPQMRVHTMMISRPKDVDTQANEAPVG
jgi:Domain of unknown function (DUF927)